MKAASVDPALVPFVECLAQLLAAQFARGIVLESHPENSLGPAGIQVKESRGRAVLPLISQMARK